MSNAKNEIKGSLEGTNNRINETEDRINEVEDRMVEMKQRGKKLKEMTTTSETTGTC